MLNLQDGSGFASVSSIIIASSSNHMIHLAMNRIETNCKMFGAHLKEIRLFTPKMPLRSKA
jgi:hypothetical protein